jgi:hypothetical protein
MQKWEYLFIYFSFDALREGWYPTYIGDPTLEALLEDDTQNEAANNLGEQGWEMVSYAPIVETHSMLNKVLLESTRMVFKRPKE